MTTLRFTVPGPPVPQARARSAKNGRHYTPDRSREYASLVALFAGSAAHITRWPMRTRGPFRVTIDAYRIADRGDVDNMAKGLTDPLTKIGVWADDRYVRELTVRMHIDKDNPRAEVTVELLEAKGAA